MTIESLVEDNENKLPHFEIKRRKIQLIQIDGLFCLNEIDTPNQFKFMKYKQYHRLDQNFFCDIKWCDQEEGNDEENQNEGDHIF